LAIASYAYFKLKIPGPNSIINMEVKAQRALDCEQNNIELVTSVVTTAELKELCLSAPPSLANMAMPSTSGTFKATEDAKAIQIDTEDPAKTIQVGANLSPKKEGDLIDFLQCNKDIFAWRTVEMMSVS
jgi:hypothetical protein